MEKKELKDIVQSYIGATPKDKGYTNWSELRDRMVAEIETMFEKEIALKKEESIVENALNAYWHDAHKNLKRDDLGIIERKQYEIQLSKTESLMKALDLI